MSDVAHEPAATVYVVDDEEGVRRALTRLIRAAGYQVQAYGLAREFLQQLAAQRSAASPHALRGPACVVLDVQMPEVSGLELQRELDATLPAVFLTGHGDIAMTVGALKAGAADFLTKPVRDAELLHAIGQALARSAAAVQQQHELHELQSRLDRLTPREREVMQLVVLGRLNKQVACELGTVEKTVKAHRARVMQKMEVASLAELVRVADKVALAGEPHTQHDMRDQGPISRGPAVS
jgi:FixJ family two-component response regulator